MGRRAMPGNAQGFTLKLLRFGNLWLNEQTHRRPIGDTAHRDKRGATQNRADYRVAGGHAHIEIAAYHRLDRNAAGTDVDEIGFDAILLKSSHLLCHPYSGKDGADRSIRNGYSG